MPFGSFQVSDEETLRNAIRLVKETGFDSVKLEGGKNKAPIVKRLTEEGIAVMGHIGLMPQMVNAMGGFRVQGRNGHEAMLEDALALEEAGAYSIVIEGCVAETAEKVSKGIKIPTIGIGAGAGCDGQVLVYHDVFGLYDDFTPKFVKQYADVKSVITDACKQYIDEVKSSKFPSKEYSY
jgi:3-methyl-2-oxobutanoate hydroxymethyltransferase